MKQYKNIFKVLWSWRLVVSWLVLPCAVVAQDFKKDMALTQAYYANRPVLNLKISMKMFAKPTSTLAFANKNFTILKTPKKFYYTSDDQMDMVLTGTSFIMIDQARRQMVYRDVNEADYKALTNKYLQTTNLDSNITRSDSVRFLGEANGIKIYNIYPSLNSIKLATLQIRAATGALVQLMYHYDNHTITGISKVEIFFQEKEGVNTALMAESKYFSRDAKNNILKKGSQYQNFEIIKIDGAF